MNVHLSEFGIHLEHDGDWGSYDVTEVDPRWPSVSAAISRYQAVSDALRGFSIAGSNQGDRVWTEFTDTERNRAPFLEIGAWHHGYPQPEDVHRFMRKTYDLSNACEICHVGAKQVAPFRMKKSPVWGRRSILQLNWVSDEFFVKPEVYETIFRPFGIGFRSVLLDKTGAELDTVVQLSIDAVVDVGVEGIPLEHVCSRCGRKSYERSRRGFPPGPVGAEASMSKSNQHFHGYSRRVYVNNSLYRKIVDAKLKGTEFDPCLENPA